MICKRRSHRIDERKHKSKEMYTSEQWRKCQGRARFYKSVPQLYWRTLLCAAISNYLISKDTSMQICSRLKKPPTLKTRSAQANADSSNRIHSLQSCHTKSQQLAPPGRLDLKRSIANSNKPQRGKSNQNPGSKNNKKISGSVVKHLIYELRDHHMRNSLKLLNK